MKPTTGKSRRQNDILWKGMLEEVFEDLLRFVFPRAEQIFDLQRGFEFLDKELGAMTPRPGRKSDTRFVDKLVKVFQRDGSEEWVLCHVEVQGADGEKKTDGILSFLHNYVRFEKPETNRIFEEEIDRLTGKTNTMGIIEQVKQMKLDEAMRVARKEEADRSKRAFVTSLLSSTTFSVKKIADLVGVSEAFVNKMKLELKAK